MNARIVIGKYFGDEGKGLAVDYFARLAEKNKKPSLVIRHNGGAQAGHTVDTYKNRFVFHQLSSGSFRGSDTFWADTFMPDLYKLSEETDGFSALCGFTPRILSFGGCRCVIIDDVLINMALETSRGKNRHGSCGMGINEAVQRSSCPDFLLTLSDIKGSDCGSIYLRLKRIRKEYLPLRLGQLKLNPEKQSEYGELLKNDNVLLRAAEGMCRGAEKAELIGGTALQAYGEVIFEGAQGLLLDEMYLKYAPHLTSSRTGLGQPLALCRKLFGGADAEAVYVTRSYVTRHGSGPLPYEGNFRYPVRDLTNLPNEWQGSLRLAAHGNYDEFISPVLADADKTDIPLSVMLTHLNETSGRFIAADGEYTLEQWKVRYRAARHFKRLYLSHSPYSEEIEAYSL